MAKDINKEPFSESTKLKLDIFSDCFREWFPVFIKTQSVKHLYVFDFFAGSGKDSLGNLGSPLVLLKEAGGGLRKYCNSIRDKEITFSFNETVQDKLEILKTNINEFIEECKVKNHCDSDCIYSNKITFSNSEFQELFKDTKLIKILENDKIAKFILLDQYGFKEVNEGIFLKLVHSPKTDFIFFISSSFIRRFRELDAVLKYFNTSKINYDESKPNECHRNIATYFRSLIPYEKEYYLHHYTIQKGANYYGLIFGTNHTLGMEKFLKVCWKNDKYAGESNCNIENDYPEGTLFHNKIDTSKIQRVKDEIRKKILSGGITNNIDGLKYALYQGCLPKVFSEVIKELLKLNKIKPIEKINFSSANIHKVDRYQIKVI